MRDFLRLQLKLKWGFNRSNNKTGAIMTAIAALFAVAVALALVWALSFVLKASVAALTAKRLAVMYLTIIMAGLLIAATGMQMTRLYRPADVNISARFPLSPFKLFISYLILNYIDLTVYAAIFTLPVMIVYGVAMHAISALYFVGVILGVIIMPLVPFSLSIFIAIPLVYVTSFLEKYGVIRLVLFVAFLVGCFVLYYYVLTALAQFFIHRNWEEGTLEIWQKLLSGLDYYYNPAYYLGNVMFFENFGLGFGAYIGAGAALTVGGVALARIVCRNIRTRALENVSGGYERHSKIDGYGSTRAIFRYTFKEILRTKTYSYFYLGVAISTPVMVFFCNRLVQIVGEAQMGGGINFGASMLVVSVFMAMICSFTGTILSVEGKKFYITKLVPVSYRKQLLIKGCLNIAVSLGALLISAVVIGALGFLNAAEISVLIAVQILFATGLVFNGINLNLANPSLKPKANGEVEEINITYMLLIGLAISATLGTCSIILPDAFGEYSVWAYIVGVGITLVYTVINVMIFAFTADKKYHKIEV